MQHQQLPPPDHLKSYIRYFWVLESNATTARCRTFNTIADGCPGLIFQQSAAGSFHQYGKQLSGLFLYGQSTTHTEISSPGTFRSIGVYFYPHALRSVFGLDAEMLTNTCMDMVPAAKLNGGSLYEQLLNTQQIADQVMLLSAYIAAQIANKGQLPCTVSHYVWTEMIRTNGLVPLKELQSRLSLSERTIERKFKQSIGISPKLFSRICRFQSSLSQLKHKDFSKLSDIAYDRDYADQSHFIRVFKEFAGCSPYQYQQRSSELVDNFPEIIPA